MEDESCIGSKKLLLISMRFFAEADSECGLEHMP